MPPSRGFDPDWKRISRWCLLGTLVMTVWLMAPVARCSFNSFRDTPISDADSDKPADSDADRVKEGTSFWTTWGSATKACYNATPMLGQEWKSTLFLCLGGATLVTWGLARWTTHKPRTFT